MSSIQLRVLHRNVCQRVIVSSTIANKPTAELLDRSKMVVACLNTESMATKICQTLNNRSGGNISNCLPPTCLGDSIDLKDVSAIPHHS